MNTVEAGGPQYSVWLVPAEPVASQLADVVASLAPVFGTPAFVPHVTLQGDLTLRLHEVARALAQLARTLPVQHWTISGIDTSAVYWRSFYLAFADAPGFAPALEQLVALTGTTVAVSPFAHLSLAYGPLSDERKATLRTTTLAQLPRTLAFDRVVVALAGKTVGVPSWRVLESFALAG